MHIPKCIRTYIQIHICMHVYVYERTCVCKSSVLLDMRIPYLSLKMI